MYELPFRPGVCGDQATTTQIYSNYSAWHRGGRYPKVLTGFIIHTEDGYSFYFGKNINPEIRTFEYFNKLPIDVSTDLYSCKDYWTADAWYLSKIVFKNGKIVNLEYERGGYIANKYRSVIDAKINNEPLNFFCQDNSIGHKAGRAISPVYLKTVYGENFSITINRIVSNELPMDIDYYQGTISKPQTVFYTHNERFKVDNIVFRTKGRVKKVKFNYVNNNSERLRLGSLAISNNDDLIKEVYTFEYIKDFTEPAYLTSQTDHWGFWMGRNAAEPSTNATNGTVYYNSRQPDFLYAKQGLLKKITYPTSGYTTFEYEANTVSKEVNLNGVGIQSLNVSKQIGGARIKEIRDYDNTTSVSSSRKFYYTSSYNSSLSEESIDTLTSTGVLNSQIQYLWSTTLLLGGKTYNVGFQGSSCNINVVTTSPNVAVFSSQPLYYLYDSYHVGYTKVYEVFSDKSYIETEFTNHDNGHTNYGYLYTINTTFESPYNKVTDKSFERGKIRKESFYDADNFILKENRYDYLRKVFSDSNKNFYSVWEGTVLFSGGCGVTNTTLQGLTYVPIGNLYSFDTYPFLIGKKTEIVYDKNNSLNRIENITEYSYESESHFFPTKIQTKNSYGENLTTLLKYPGDIEGEHLMSRIASVKPNTVIERIDLKKDSLSGKLKVIGGELHEYGLKPLNSGYGTMPWLNTIYTFQSDKPVDYSDFDTTQHITRSFSSTAVYPKDPGYKQTTRFNSYDYYYNPIDIINRDGLVRKIITGNKGTNVLVDGAASFSYYWQGFGNPTLYTSFEKYQYYDNEGFIQTGVDADDMFEYTGTFDENNAYSGRFGFSGTVKPKMMVHVVTITVFAKSGGNAPVYKLTIGGTMSTPANQFVKIGEKNGWDIYQVFHSSGGSIPFIESNGNVIDDVRMADVNNFLNLNTFVYDKGLMISSMDISLNKTYYEYDSFGRLILVKDKDSNIIKRYCYSIDGRTYDCAGQYTYYNDVITKAYTKTCSPGYTGSTHLFTMPAGTYSSNISKEQANTLAETVLDSLGQANAQLIGNCTITCVPSACSGVNRKCVNGICETGTYVMDSCYYDSGTNMYTVVYYYLFSDNSRTDYFYITSEEACIDID